MTSPTGITMSRTGTIRGLSVCLIGCGAHTANGFNMLVEYNHIWNVMQGFTADGGAIYFNVGARDGTGAGNKILNNLDTR